MPGMSKGVVVSTRPVEHSGRTKMQYRTVLGGECGSAQRASDHRKGIRLQVQFPRDGGVAPRDRHRDRIFGQQRLQKLESGFGLATGQKRENPRYDETGIAGTKRQRRRTVLEPGGRCSASTKSDPR